MKQRSLTESTVNVLKKINLNKIILWMTVLQFFITGAFYWFSYNHLSSQAEAQFNLSGSSTIQAQVERLEKDYQQNQLYYQRTIDSLSNELLLTDHVLKNQVQYSKIQKLEIEKLLLLNWDTLSTDSRIQNCDSLRFQTQEYLITDSLKDESMNQKMIQLDALFSESQRSLRNCDSAFNALHQRMDIALVHTQQCEQEFKRLKRQNRIIKFSAGAIAILSIGLALK